MADTDILLTIDLDAREAVQTAEQLHQEVDKIFANRKGQQSAALTGLQTEMKQTVRSIKAVSENLATLRQSNVMGNEARSLSEVLENVTKLQLRYAALQEAIKEAGESGSANFFGAKMTLEELEEEANKTAEALEVMTERAKQEIELDSLNDKLKQMIIKHRELAAKENQQASILKRLRELWGGIKNATNKVVSAARTLFGLVKRLVTRTKGAGSTMSRLAKTLLLTGLGMRSMFALFNKLRSAVITGFNNMLDSSKALRDQVDSLQNSLSHLKNSIASVLQPIVSMAIPYLEAISNYMSEILDKAARFVAAATGQKYYMKAIQQTGRAAEKAKQQLSGLDNLNVLNGKSMFEQVEIDPEQYDMFEAFTELMGKMKQLGNDVGNWIVDNLGKIDWDKIIRGAHLSAEGISDFLNGLLNTEDLGEQLGSFFANLGNTVIEFGETLVKTFDFKKAGDQLADSVNQFVNEFNWDGLGELIGGFLRGAVDFAYNFAFGVDIDELARKISGTINDILAKLNEKDVTGKNGWQKMGGVIASIFNLLYQIFDHVDWKSLITGVIQMFETAWNTMDPEAKVKLGALIFTAIGVVTLAEVAKKALVTMVGNAITAALGGTAAAGGAAAAGGTVTLPVVLALAVAGVELAAMGKNLVDQTKNLGNMFSDIFYTSKEKGGLGKGLADYDKRRTEAAKQIKEEWKEKGYLNDLGLPTLKGLSYDFFGNKFEAEISKRAEELKNESSDVAQTVITGYCEGLNNAWTMNQLDQQFEVEKIFSSTQVQDLKDAGIALGTSVIDSYSIGLTGEWFNVEPSIESDVWNKSAKDAEQSLNENHFKQLGANVVSAVANGIKSKLSEVRSAMQELSNIMGIPAISTGAVVPQTSVFNSAVNPTTPPRSLKDIDNGMATREQEIVLNLDGHEIMRAMVKENNSYKKQHSGMSAFA